jgi:hypothetical protein
MALPSLLLPLVREGSRLFEGSLEEPLRLAHRMVGEPSPPWLVGYLLATQALLVWFTYFSRSARVKDSDKFAVFLLMCVAAISWFETLAQWLARR